MNNLTILPSTIQGKGVFATKDFKKGETIINWEPCITKITNEEIKQLEPIEKKYVYKNTLLQSPNRFLNHSCNNNTLPKNGVNVAIKDIIKGQEITTNYDKEDIPKLNLKCRCRDDCKRII
jgi:SET domain-containing protein